MCQAETETRFFVGCCFFPPKFAWKRHFWGKHEHGFCNQQAHAQPEQGRQYLKVFSFLGKKGARLMELRL